MSVGIPRRKRRHSAVERTGVLPRRTECFGPRTAAAGEPGTTWRTVSQSNRRRMAASSCLTVGRDTSRMRDSSQAAMWTERTCADVQDPVFGEPGFPRFGSAAGDLCRDRRRGRRNAGTPALPGFRSCERCPWLSCPAALPVVLTLHKRCYVRLKAGLQGRRGPGRQEQSAA